MRAIKCLLLLLFAVNIQAYAQNKWYIEPAVSTGVVASDKDNGGWRLGLLAGYYVTKDADIRVDLQGDYFFMDKTKDWYSLSVLLSTDSQLERWNRFYTTTSLGIGYMSSRSIDNGIEKRYNDVILPMKMGLRYAIFPSLHIGVELCSNINLSKIKERSMIYAGAVLGFRF